MAIERANLSLALSEAQSVMFPAAQARQDQARQGEAEVEGGQRKPRRREPPAEAVTAQPATDGKPEGKREGEDQGGEDEGKDKNDEGSKMGRSPHRIDSLA